MIIPGFTAEASLYQTSRRYHAVDAQGQWAGSKALFLSFPLIDLVDRTELGFPAI
jgi:hypothetical protein